MTDRLSQARDAYWKAHTGQVRTALQVDALRFGVEWADANPKPHPRPGDGCQCTGYSQDAGGGYFEYLVEYEPACPEHSEHVYNPRIGAWEHANPQPRTITRKELNTAMLRAPRGSGAAGVLAQLGIEVGDGEPEIPETCAACGEPADGFAMINDERYCHPDEGPSCYGGGAP